MLLLWLKKAQVLFVLIFLFYFLDTNGQTNNRYPKIGDTIPHFILKDIHFYSVRQAGSDDFRGKPLILDFFSEGCSACFESFPKVNELKKQFDGKVQFMLIGLKSHGIAKQYEKFRNHFNLHLPVDWDDSTINNQFGVVWMPYTLWIDGNGIIRQITTSFAMDSVRLNRFVKGEKQSLEVTVNRSDIENTPPGKEFYKRYYDWDKPLLIRGNGGADTAFLFRSLLCLWDPRSGLVQDMYIGSKNKNKVEEIQIDVNKLFLLAYGDTADFLRPRPLMEDENLPNHYGQWDRFPVDSSTRKVKYNIQNESATNNFSYSLIIPDSIAGPTKLQKIMQRDLRNYFSLEATVETRKVACWKIIAGKNTEKLCRTRGGNPEWNESFSGFTFKNQPIHSLLLEIWDFHQMEGNIYDETGIDYNIDLRMDAIMTDINDIKLSLRKFGFDLVRTEKEMKVIVIRDVKE